MSAKKILGGVLLIAGALLTMTGVGAAIGLPMIAAGISSATVIGLGLMVAGSMLIGPSVPKIPASLAGGGRERLHASLDLRAPRKILFGDTAGATDVRYQTFTGEEQEYLEQIICVASHKVSSIYELWLDNEKAWSSSNGVQGDFVDYLTVTTRTEGTSGNGIPIDSVWTASATLTGCAYLHVRYKLTGPDDQTPGPFSSGVTSRMTIRCKGAYVCDPRLDSTVSGGSGSHRADNQATWTWSDNGSRNPALQLLFFLLGWKINGKLAVGMGLPKARIDLPSFITAANVCDESVTKATGGTEPRYRCDGVLSEADDRLAVIEALCTSMNAIVRDSGGKLSLHVLKNDLATPVADFTEDDIIGAVDWRQTPDLSSTFNITRGQRIDPADNALYQPVDYAEVKIASIDGIDRIDTLDLPMVQSNGQAQRLAKQRLQRNQYQGRARFVGKPSWWQVNLGDVVRFSHQSYGWSNKLFRVAGLQISRSGETEIILIEEHSDLYQWDNNESPAVTAGTPTVYDPANSPILKGVEGAAAPTTGNMLTDVLFGGKWTKTAGALRRKANSTGGYALGFEKWHLQLSPSNSQVRSATSEKVPINPGQKYFFRAKAQRGTSLGSGSRLRFDVVWLASNQTTVVSTETITAAEQTPSTLTAGAMPKEIAWSATAPATAYFVQMKPYTPAVSQSSGTFRVEGPWISVIDPQGVPEIGYGPSSHTVKYKADGTAESGELPIDLAYIFYLGGVAQTAGVTWTYRVLDGIVNTFTIDSGVKSMSGPGTGTFTLSSLGSDNATVELNAAKSGSSAKFMLALKKQVAAPASGGGGGGGGGGGTDSPSQNSGFSSFSSTSFAAISNELLFTPASGTTATVTVNLNANPAKGGADASWTVEMKVQWWNGSAWADVGSTFSGTTRLETDDESGFQRAIPVNLAGTRQSTGLTATTQYKWRVVARITSGSKTHYVSGSVSVAAP